MQMQRLEKYPIICPGNQLIQLINGGYYIGSSRRGYCFAEVERFRFLQYCNGQREIKEISTIIGTDTETLKKYLSEGLSSGYLINISKSLGLTSLNSMIGEFGTSVNKMLPTIKTRRDCEYDFYLRKSKFNQKIGPVNSPAEFFDHRAKQEILIFGANQFTIQLLATLQSAGFSRSRIIGSFSKDHLQVIADDISGGVIQSSDVGSTLSQMSKRVSREHQLVNLGNQQISTNNKPALIIAMQPIPADYQQRWLSESTPHLVIGAIIENQLEIGPIVLPGRSTCLRCIDLTFVANALTPEIATLSHLSSLERLPASILAILVGMVSIFASTFLDLTAEANNLATHPLISAALRIDLANPCKQAHIKWQPNSMCGCKADLAQYAHGEVR